ncbi:hypothetical protein MPRF_38930 [Mycolicibacterium parafortuitum]|uniref:Helix-turn-helix domain-containing protein n=1 Tax=Mycolicibacterium parafortuitum TaxID=39692 RepID=A0A7I7U6J0_MYCPF|nr:hypothetical protein [Mycolicibacterium parafortuitum]BBY76994.1 hypothetical protein MPRF_38930 [Mycolicibacterium parafortuitum]
MIAAVNGVMLAADDAETLLGALDLLERLLAERRSRPSAKLVHTTAQLRRATRKCAAQAAAATAAGSSPADQTNRRHDGGYATVTSSEAARILGVTTNAVRALARRNPRRLGSQRVGNRWVHDLARVEHRAARRKGR